MDLSGDDQVREFNDVHVHTSICLSGQNESCCCRRKKVLEIEEHVDG